MKEVEQKEYYYSFNKNIKPLITIASGETVVVKTSDNVNNRIRTGTDPKEMDLLNADTLFNPLSGPIYLEGAKKGDTIAIDIVDIKVQPGWGQGWTGQGGWLGTMMSGAAANLLAPIPNIIKICKIDDKIHFPLKNNREILLDPAPFPGTIGTCPIIEVNSCGLGPFGGNMDSPDLARGSKLYLPVFVDGGLIFVGDVHYLQGEGELGGPAVEVPSLITLKINLVKDKKINWPRIENSEYIMTVGNTRPLDDCLRTASVEMVLMLEKDYGFDRWDAAILLNAVSKLVINQATNALYSITCKFPKKYLK